MPEITLITKKNGRPTPYGDSVLSFAMKGGDVTINVIQNFSGSLKLGKPYGIINDGTSDPLGLTFDETNRKVYVKKGLFMAYGRLCEIPEDGLVIDFSSITPSSTNKVYYVIYAIIDVNDAVVNSATIAISDPGSAFVNIDALQDQDDLYLREYGLFRMPIGQFSYSPTQLGGHYFDDYQKIPTTYDDGTVQVTDSIEQTGLIGSKSPTEIFEMESTSRGNVLTEKFLKADNTDAEASYETNEPWTCPNCHNRVSSGKQCTSCGNMKPGYSIAEVAEAFGEVGDSHEFSETLDGLITYRRMKVFDLDNSFGTSGMSFEKEFECDWDKLISLKFLFDSVVLCARCVYEHKEIVAFGASGWFGGSNEWETEFYSDTMEEAHSSDPGYSSKPKIKVKQGGQYGLIADISAVLPPFGKNDFSDRSVTKIVYQLWGHLETFDHHHCELHISKAVYRSDHERYLPENISGYHNLIDLIGIPTVSFQSGDTVFATIIVEKVTGEKKVKISMTGEGASGWLYYPYTNYFEYRSLQVDKASGSLNVEFQYEGAPFGD